MRISRRRARRALAAAGIHFLYTALRLIPRRLALMKCRILGTIAWTFDSRGRKVALDNTGIVYGETLPLRERRALVHAAYRNLAANLVDLSRLSSLSDEALLSLVAVDVESLRHLDGAVETGRGIILLTPHLGNWELLTAYMAVRGVKVHFVGRRPYDERLERLFENVRSSHGAAWVSRGGAFDQLVDLLSGGEVAIMLIDQDTGRVKGTFVDFFGSPAWTATGPAVLARLTGALLLPGALVRVKKERYRLVLDEPVERVMTGDDEYDDWETTRRASLALESLVRRFPDQWAWFHRRWRTRPPLDWQPPSPAGAAPPIDDLTEDGEPI